MGADLPNSDANSATDMQLIARIAQADEHALLSLIDRYGNLVYSLAMRVVQHAGLADEITQDVFVKVWQQPHAYVPAKARFSSWLLTVTRYTAIDHLRRETRQSAGNFPLDEAADLSHDADLPDAKFTDFEAEMMRALLDELPREQAQAIELAFFQGLSREAMAVQLGVPVGTVKTRLRLGLKKLRVLWEEKLESIENPASVKK